MPHTRPQAEELSPVLERNIQTLMERRQREKERAGPQERIAEAITRFAGSMKFIYLHLVYFGAWILINAGIFPVIRPFDPTFVILAILASVEAIFLSTFVLITQNRMSAIAERQSDLHLQVGLLAEHEITRLITLVSEVARKLGIDPEESADLADLEKDVSPEQVLDRIDEHDERARNTD